MDTVKMKDETLIKSIKYISDIFQKAKKKLNVKSQRVEILPEWALLSLFFILLHFHRIFVFHSHPYD